MKVIVGLGNPGPRYRHTRHNFGFMVLERLGQKLGASAEREKHQGLLCEARHGAEKLLLVRPLTFMNRSGDCVAPVVRNTIFTPADLLVVTDDIHLPLGKMRLRAGGSAGGHNGLKSLIERLGTPDFHRLRLGVGDDRHSDDLADHVLAKFLPDERDLVEETTERAAEAVLCWITDGVERAMNQYN